MQIIQTGLNGLSQMLNAHNFLTDSTSVINTEDVGFWALVGVFALVIP